MNKVITDLSFLDRASSQGGDVVQVSRWTRSGGSRYGIERALSQAPSYLYLQWVFVNVVSHVAVVLVMVTEFPR